MSTSLYAHRTAAQYAAAQAMAACSSAILQGPNRKAETWVPSPDPSCAQASYITSGKLILPPYSDRIQTLNVD